MLLLLRRHKQSHSSRVDVSFTVHNGPDHMYDSNTSKKCVCVCVLYLDVLSGPHSSTLNRPVWWLTLDFKLGLELASG